MTLSFQCSLFKQGTPGLIGKLINYLELKENTDKSKILLISQYSKNLEKADNLGINKIGSDNYFKAEEATEQDPNKRNTLTLISSEERTGNTLIKAGSTSPQSKKTSKFFNLPLPEQSSQSDSSEDTDTNTYGKRMRTGMM